jgi:hypothetical protein
MVLRINPEFAKFAKGALVDPMPTKDEINTQLKSVIEHQEKCLNDAEEFLSIYWHTDKQTLVSRRIDEWLASHQPLDRWFYIHLVDLAGRKGARVGNSQSKAAIAGKKNANIREWVLEQWESRNDKGQSKASFSKQYASLVKSKYQITIGADTIARDWLPRGGKVV